MNKTNEQHIYFVNTRFANRKDKGLMSDDSQRILR